MRRRVFFRSWIFFCAGVIQFLLLSTPGQAKYIGADPPCTCCSCPSCCGQQERSVTGTTVSRTEGNLAERLNLSRLSGASGSTLAFTVIYNSYNADTSRAQVDTVMGYGWTHSYNVFLFNQLGAMFRYDGDGRVTRYGLGPGNTYTAAPGYFETLVKNPDGTFTLTQKDKTTYTFALIAGTPFLVGGPVWRLTKIVDRNGNITALTYTAGNLTSVTDTYGHSLTFAYDARPKLIQVTDPAGRHTNFTYDSTGRKLTAITDANGNSNQYSYNVLYQLTSKIDRDGRTFTYSYQNNEPVAVNDSAGASPAHLSNTNNWATDAAQLAMFQTRVYVPSTTSNTDGRSNVWQYQYDANGHMTKTIAPDTATTTYTYDPSTLLPTIKTDANGNSTIYQYDSKGNLIKLTDALGHITTYTYEPVFNMMTSMTDPRSRTTTATYDAQGNRLQETDPLGQTRKWTYDVHGNVLTETDKNNHTITYQYDASGNRTKVTDPLGNITTMTYDAVGNVLSRTDPNSHTTTYQYDGLNRLTKETDATGHISQNVYDGQGNRIQTIDRNNHATSYQYDLRQRLIKTTDALGQVDSYTYDGNDNRLSATDRNSHTAVYQYDVQNRQNKLTDALGNVTTTLYDPVGNVSAQTDANSHTSTYTYDALNRRVTMTDAAGDLTRYQYDTGTLASCPLCGATPGSNLLTGQTDANGKVIFYKYDALDRRIDIVAKVGSTADTITPSDAVTVYTYDPVNNRLGRTEPNGNTMTWQYDADDRRTKETNAAGDVRTMTYDGVGNVISTTDPNLNVTTNTYDVLNRVIQVTDSIGTFATFTYDPAGNRLSKADGNGNTWMYTYDALNRMTATTDSLGKPSTTQYDPAGNAIKTTDRNGNVTTYVHDAINRRTSMMDPLAHTTQFQYDAVGNMTRITDANLHTTQYAYDPVNRPLQETFADGRMRSFSYDAVGNILTRTDQLGQVITYVYNDLYYLTGRSYPSAINDTFGYDLSGRILNAQRGTWPVTFIYDGANRVTQTVQNGHTVSYSYNIPGRTRTITYPGGRIVTEKTDARTRLDHIDDAASPPSIVQYVYDPGNRPATRTYRNGVAGTYTYNADDWTLSAQHALGATQIAAFNYTYDNEGNKQFEQKLHDTAHSEAYLYDAAYRLITYKVGTLVGSTVPVPSTQTSYNLDPVGNWNSKTTNAVTQNRVHDVVNELTKIDAANLTYDFDGNLKNDGAFAYTYDEENRLTAVTRVSDSVTVGAYLYDAFGRRVQKIAQPFGPPVTTIHLYDDARVIEEQNSVGVTQATYVYGNYVDEILTMERAGQTYYYHQNALMSVEAITNNTGIPVERYAYDAYGVVSVTNGAGVPVPPNSWGTPHSVVGNPWIFTGRQIDEETGLYFYRARSYDAAKGRFLQRDPIEYKGGMNLYEYNKSEPTKYVDPAGTLSVWLLGKYLSADGARCGQTHYIDWDFELDRASPCDGYIVQQVDIYETRRNCENCPDKAPAQPTTTYWEAWWVRRGGTLQELRGGARGGIGPTTYTDRASVPHTQGTCAAYNQVGTIKFFCKDGSAAGSVGGAIGGAVGGGVIGGLPGAVFGGLIGAFVGSAWNRAGTGDLGKENEAPAAAGSDWGPNKDFNGTTPGWLPATNRKPAWWDRRPIEGPATRRMDNKWCCCEGKDPVSQSDGTPLTRKPAR